MAALPADLERLLHDLRGPLNAMAMHVEILRRLGGSEPGARASLEVLQQEIGRLAAMLPAAFAVMALEPGVPERVNLRTLAERALADQPPGAVTLASGPWPDVCVHAPLLVLAIDHLVRNALEATRAGGERPAQPCVSCEVAPPGSVTLVVRDWGRGLPATNPHALIRLAPRTSNARPRAGLVSVERIARLHGGSLTFLTPPDGGAEVRLVLPMGGLT
jgi:signal transduction histidine kinase